MVFVSVPELWTYFFRVSSLAYPNLLGKKGYVVVVVYDICFCVSSFNELTYPPYNGKFLLRLSVSKTHNRTIVWHWGLWLCWKIKSIERPKSQLLPLLFFASNFLLSFHPRRSMTSLTSPSMICILHFYPVKLEDDLMPPSKHSGSIPLIWLLPFCTKWGKTELGAG